MMAMLDMLQLPDGSFAMPSGAVDPFTGASAAELAAQARAAAAERGRRGIRRPAPAAIDYGDWDSGAAPVPYPSLSGLGSAAATLAPPPAATPTAAPPGPSATDQSWLGMLNQTNPNAAPPGWMSSSAALPAAATPASGPVAAPPPARAPLAAPAAPAASSAVPETSLLGRVFQGIGDAVKGFDDWRKENRTTLMALGAGMAGAQNFGQGLNRGMTMAILAMQQDLRQAQLNQSIPVIADRLVKTGMSPTDARQTAIAATTNPAIMQQLLPSLFGPKQRQFTQIGEDAFGTKEFGFVDPVAGRVYRLDGSEVGAGGGAGGGGLGGGSEFLAKGVSQIDHGLVGENYLTQFSPEVQAAVRNYVNGESMPTGNPRKGFTQAVKMIAQKYGQDIGFPADDTNYAERRKLRDQLASGAPNSLGGQLRSGKTAIEHLADVSDAAVDLQNSGGWGIAPLAHAVNLLRGQTTDQAGKIKALDDRSQHYGQEITKFYAGSPGGEAERQRFLTSIGSRNSPTELADVLESEKRLIPGKMDTIEDDIRSRLGDAGLARYPISADPRMQKALARLDANIAKLRGIAPASETRGSDTNQPARPASKADYDALPNGASYMAPDGSVRLKTGSTPPVSGARKAPDGHWYIGEPGTYHRVIP
jgi:hypothetical protein